MGRDLANRAANQRTGTTPTEEQKTLGRQIQDMQEQFQLAMPRGVEAGQLVRDALTCVRGTPKLAGCYAPSVLGGLMTCAQLGLRPGVAGLGHAWLIPMWNDREKRKDATLIIGYRGYTELAYRHEKVISIASRVVYGNDDFEMYYSLEGDHLVHRPRLDGHRGEPRLYYALARLQGGYAMTEPWSQADMMAHRDRYAMAKWKDRDTGVEKILGPWADAAQAIEMGRKTMIRGPLLKMIPLSTELAIAAAIDEGVRVDLTPDIDPAEVTNHLVGEVEPEEEPSEGRAGEQGQTDAWPEAVKPGEG